MSVRSRVRHLKLMNEVALNLRELDKTVTSKTGVNYLKIEKDGAILRPPGQKVCYFCLLDVQFCLLSNSIQS